MVVLGTAQEIERGMADGGHVLQPLSGPGATQALVKDDVEHPVQAVLDVPVLPDGAGEEFGIKRERAEVEAALTAGVSGVFDLGLHHGDGLEAGKAWLSGEAPIGAGESDVVADGMVTLLDAAMIAVDGGLGEQARGLGIVEGARDLGVEIGLVVLHGEEVAGVLAKGLLRDLGLAPHGVDGDQGATVRQAITK